MKKYALLLVSFLWLISSDSFAGEFGIRAGYNYGMTLNGGIRVENPISGYYGGFYKTSYPLGVKFLGVQSGAEVALLGHRKDANTYRQQYYVGVPLSLRLKLGPIFIIGGVNGQVKVFEKRMIDGVEVDDKSSLFDAHTHAGVGVKLGMFSFEARYHHGLIDINKGNKTEYVQLGACITF
ncbi:MAG: PorT family protein [Bacteroidota bacterium]|nr:PorT family protein [Bacteroidota bacterium]MDX5431375.1 PorT family protein [Bacteroidota bacterium]MDX5470105.1 PorT family protein [Bacteroidota bacterium]